MKTLNDVVSAVEAFLQVVPIQAVITVSESWSIPEDWHRSFPNSELPGVYFFLDAAGALIYVGKASAGLGQRLGNGYIGRNGVIKDTKIQGAKFLHTLPLPKELFFLAPALEEFLIFKLDPASNTVGRPAKT